MKYKLAGLLLVAFVSLSFNITKRYLLVDTDKMALINKGNYIRGLDSTQLNNLMSRFNEPNSFFSQEIPRFRMTVASFYIDKYEVTNKQFQKFVKANPKWSKSKIPDSLHNGNYLKDWNNNDYPKGKANYPVVYVSWYAASAYAKWIGKRLPMEAEWECVAKEINGASNFSSGNSEAYPNDIDYISDSSQPEPVGKHHPNKLGIYDLYGNVSELCIDRWRENDYAGKSHDIKYRNLNITNIANDKNKVVLRGGNFESKPVDFRVTKRASFAITGCEATVGFRCAANFVETANPR